MLDDSTVRRVREAIRERGKKPARDRIEDMIQRGVIDREGHILLCMPQAPEDCPEAGPEGNGSEKG